MVQWKRFLEAIAEDPKQFAMALVKHLDPPEYAKQILINFNWICSYCWIPRVDECALCGASICTAHIGKTWIDPRGPIEWYFCKNCTTHHKEKVELKIKEIEETELEDILGE